MFIQNLNNDYDNYAQIYAWEKTLCSYLKLHEFNIGNLFFEVVAFGFYDPDNNIYHTHYALIDTTHNKLYRALSDTDCVKMAIDVFNGLFNLASTPNYSLRGQLFRTLDKKIQETQATAMAC